MPPSLLPFLQYTVVVAVALLMRERGAPGFQKKKKGKVGVLIGFPFSSIFLRIYRRRPAYLLSPASKIEPPAAGRHRLLPLKGGKVDS